MVRASLRAIHACTFVDSQSHPHPLDGEPVQSQPWPACRSLANKVGWRFLHHAYQSKPRGHWESINWPLAASFYSEQRRSNSMAGCHFIIWGHKILFTTSAPSIYFACDKLDTDLTVWTVCSHNYFIMKQGSTHMFWSLGQTRCYFFKGYQVKEITVNCISKQDAVSSLWHSSIVLFLNWCKKQHQMWSYGMKWNPM